jgi:tRNA threonylcarbamoyladenosine biosynthesis protein TsaE
MRLPFITARTADAAETRELGFALGARARPGDVLLLIGDLGTGKTTFVQGLARGLDVLVPCTSPSYTLMHAYEGRFPMLHLDLFRCERGQEVIDLGLEDMLEAPWVVAIEWGERAGPLLADDFLEVELAWADGSDDARLIHLRPYGRWRERMKELAEAVGGGRV